MRELELLLFFSNFIARWGHFDPVVTDRVNFVRVNLLQNVCYIKTYNPCQFRTLLVERTAVINFFSNFIVLWGHFDPLVTNTVNVVCSNLHWKVFYTRTYNPYQFSTFFIWENSCYFFFRVLELHHYDLLVSNRVNFVRPNLIWNVCYTKTYNPCQFSTLHVERTPVITFFSEFYSSVESFWFLYQNI